MDVVKRSPLLRRTPLRTLSDALDRHWPEATA
jgi:hypothetical protein